MCSSNISHQAAGAQEEGTTEIETRPSAPYRTSQTSHPSNSSPPHQLAMSSSTTNPSSPNPQSHLEAQGSKSSNSLKAATISSPTRSPPPYAASSRFELGVDPSTIATASRLERPSLEQLRSRIQDLREQLASERPPHSQYLWVTQIPDPLFTNLHQESELLKGVRATILPYKQQILYKIIPGSHHEQIIQMFTYFLTLTLSEMGLTPIHRDFWLGGTTTMTGHPTKKEPDNCLFPGNRFAAGANSQWPSLVLEVGISESLAQLRTDAQWWYSNSERQTKMVALIHANADNADIEIWTEVYQGGLSVTTQSEDGMALRRTQYASLKNGRVSGALEPDFLTLMRRPPRNSREGNLQLTPFWIQEICQR